jgi:chromosomal replication initiator protein
MRTTADRMSQPASPRAWAPPGFVTLPENRAARLAIRRLAARLKSRAPFVPLFLFGPPGCGKTHLAQALLDWAGNNGFSCRAADLDPESTPRDRPLLVVEDIAFLPQRHGDWLAGVIDDRSARRLATVITAPVGPSELDLPARLTNRLAGGLVVGIESYGQASRRVLLGRFARRLKIAARPEVLDFLAVQTPGSGRQLLADLQRLATIPGSRGALPSISDVMAAMTAADPLSLERIVKQVGRHFRVKESALRSRDRHPGTLWPRQISMYLARETTRLSLARIGEWFGRDHTTVLHACRKVERMRDEDASLAALLRQLQARLT